MEVHLPPDLQSKLTRLAGQQGRNSESLVAEAVERMLDHEDWFLAQVDEGLAQIEAGKTLSHEEVGDRLKIYVAQSPAHR